MDSTVVSRYRLCLLRDPEALAEPLPVLSRPAETALFLWSHIFETSPQEAVAVLYLNNQNELTGWAVPFVGSISNCTADPRHILVPALLVNSPSIILAHNHPVGAAVPSQSDYVFTRRLALAAHLVGVTLLDHFILADPRSRSVPRWTSLAVQGVLPLRETFDQAVARLL